MKTYLTIVVAVLSLSNLAADEKNAEDRERLKRINDENLFELIIKDTNRAVAVLKTVKDKETADKALPEIRELRKRLVCRLEKVKGPRGELPEKLQRQLFAPVFEGFAEVFRLRDQDYAKELVEAWTGLDKKEEDKEGK